MSTSARGRPPQTRAGDNAMKDAATVVLLICAVAGLPILVRALVRTLPRTPAASLRDAMPWSPRDTASRLRQGAVAAHGAAAALTAACVFAAVAAVALAAVGDQDAALTVAAIVAACHRIVLSVVMSASTSSRSVSSTRQ